MASLTITLIVGPGAANPTITFTPTSELEDLGGGTYGTGQGALPEDMLLGRITVDPPETELWVEDEIWFLLESAGSGLWNLLTGVRLEEGTYQATVTSEASSTPPGPVTGLLATITFPHGTFSFDEADGEELDAWTDPRGEFVLTRERVTNAAVPHFWVDFVRANNATGEADWASVEFRYGTAGQTGNLGEYLVTITGDFEGHASCPAHWWGARWRMSGNRANGLRPGGNDDWPFPPTPYADLLAERLIPAYDASRLSPVLPQEVLPYTPMGHSSYTLQQGAGGARSDIGLFSDWDGSALAALAPNAASDLVALISLLLANVRTLAEAACSIPIAGMNAEGTAVFDYVTQPNPGGGPSIQSTIEAIVIGPPNTAQSFVQGSYLSDSVSGGVWWLQQTVQLNASGRGSAWVKNYQGMGPQPKGTPILADDPNPNHCTFEWGDISAWSPPCDWVLDTSHYPETGYVAYILWRDPWDLDTCQRNALCAAYYYGQNFKIFQVRQCAWDYRGALLAWRATPETATDWLLPKATFATWLVRLQDVILATAVDATAVAGGDVLSRVFHCLEAANMSNGYNLTDTAGNVVVHQGALAMPWQNAYAAQAFAFAVYQRPDDAKARRLAEFSLTHLQDQSSNATGWPAGELPMYYQGLARQGGPPFFGSWGEAWAFNCPVVHNINQDGQILPIPPDYICPGSPSIPPVTAYNANYSNEFWFALSLAVQAEMSAFVAARDWWAKPCLETYYVEQSRVLVQ